jgi:signal transduction histidine kinase
VQITTDPDLAHAIDTVINVTAFVLFALTAAFLWRHWQRANRAERRAIGPVLLTGATVLALLEVGLFGKLSGHDTVAEVGYYATQAAILPLPYAFLASLARSRLSRGDAVSELVARLAGPGSGGDPRGARPGARRPVAGAGLLAARVRHLRARGWPPVELPDGSGERAATLIERNGKPVAALVHAAALRDDRGLLDAVAAAGAIALENMRLNVELLARLEELRGSRARIVEAGDAERRRLERNLHDGAQQRLVAVALQLRLLQRRISDDPGAAEMASAVGEELAQSP